MRKILLTLFSLLIFCFSQLNFTALAEINFNHLTNIQLQQISEIQSSLHTINDLQLRNIINNDVAKSQDEYYLHQAEIIVNSPITTTQINYLVKQYQSRLENPISNSWQRLKGFFSFVNVLWILATIILVVSIAWLLSIYLLPILLAIPAVFYEFLVYVACFYSIFAGQLFNFNSGVGEFIALPGCLGLIGAFVLSNYLHKEYLQKFYAEKKIDVITFYSSILFIIWAGIAIIYESVIIGFLTVLALETLLGFSVLVMPLCYCIGFRERKIIPVATSASFFLLVFYVIVRLTNTNLLYINIFSPGALFLGTFVYFIGLLILSSKFYRYDNWQHYLWLQFVTVVSGIMAIFVGSVWQISQLSGIGGTFFFLYIIEKYWELPWHRKSWAWATLGLGVVLYLSSFVMKQYPEYFLFSIS